jgi:hypothetical protein
MKIWNKNQTVNNNDLIFTIVPNDYSAYVVKLQVPVLNSGKIMVNQDVIIKLNEYQFNEYGSLKGKVEKISLVPNSEGLYLIDVSLPNKLITSHDIEIDFKQEMQGVAEIITEDLRLVERLFYQFKQIFSR